MGWLQDGVDLWNELDDKKILDTPAPGMYFRAMLENLNPKEPLLATERILPPEEEASLKEIVQDKIKSGGNGLSYGDFKTYEEGAAPLGYHVGIPDLNDPRESLRLLLGSADITADEDGNVYVEDVFDFNLPREEQDASLLERMGLGAEALMSDKSMYGKIHRIGELFADPIPVKLKIGNAAELGVDAKQLKKLKPVRYGTDAERMAEQVDNLGANADEFVDMVKTGFESTIK